jgi:hypothetical protein
LKQKKVGIFSSSIIKKLNLNIKIGTPIYLGESNIQHMITRHPSDYVKYGKLIPQIIAHPDYVAINKKDLSIEYVKTFKTTNQYVKIAIRISTNNIYYVRSLYILNSKRVLRFIKSGKLKPV